MRADPMKILILLAERKMTQCQLAQFSGVTRQQIYIILGKGKCRPATAGKLASALGVGVTEILSEVQ